MVSITSINYIIPDNLSDQPRWCQTGWSRLSSSTFLWCDTTSSHHQNTWLRDVHYLTFWWPTILILWTYFWMSNILSDLSIFLAILFEHQFSLETLILILSSSPILSSLSLVLRLDVMQEKSEDTKIVTNHIKITERSWGYDNVDLSSARYKYTTISCSHRFVSARLHSASALVDPEDLASQATIFTLST